MYKRQISGGYNMARDATCSLSAAGDKPNVDPGLVANNVLGDARVTYLPAYRSPAIDTGQPGCTGTDQLGRPRPTDGDHDFTAECDRGAIEAAAYAPHVFTVNSAVDVADAAVGDGACQTAVVGQCTLRAAIMEANGGNGPVNITLAAVTYVLTPALADLHLAGDITVVGQAGTVIEVNELIHNGGMYPITPIVVETSGILRMSNVTFRSTAYGSTSIRNHGNAQLTGVSVANEPFDSTSIGIANDGYLTLTGGTMTRAGIGIRNAAGRKITVTNVTFDNSYYAGIENAGDAIVAASTFVHHQGASTDGVLSTGGTLSIGRSTFTDLVTGLRFTGGEGALASSTLAGSTNRNLIVTSGKLTVGNTIIATLGITPVNCTHPNYSYSAGSNLYSDASCIGSLPTDRNNTDPLLGPLADNGGPTMTFMPLAGSPAVDTGKGCSGVDQRGRLRPFDGDGNGTSICDRGSVERGA